MDFGIFKKQMLTVLEKQSIVSDGKHLPVFAFIESSANIVKFLEKPCVKRFIFILFGASFSTSITKLYPIRKQRHTQGSCKI